MSGLRVSRLVVTAALGVIVVGSGTLAGASPAADEQAAELRLGYTCQAPSGPYPVDLRITATFPDTGAVGAPIQPADVAAAVTLPPEIGAELAAMDAATVTGVAELTTVVAANGESATANWSALHAPAADLPGDGPLVLDATGPVSPVTVGSAGQVSFTAAGFGIVLTPFLAGGAPTDPATMPLTCAVDPGQDATLATVRVWAAASRTSTSPTAPGQTPAPGDGGIEVGPQPDQDGPGANAIDDAPPGCFDFQAPPPAVAGCAYLRGYSNVAKLGGAVLVGMDEPLPNLKISLGQSSVFIPGCDDGDGYTCVYAIESVSQAKLSLLPAQATLLSFGFMPVRATMELTELQAADIVSRTERHDYPAPTPDRFPITVTATSEMAIRIRDVTVNGVPLDVGSNCRTGRPVEVELTGGAANSIPQNPEEYTITFGGPIRGVVTIPPFSGCGVAEDLDPLFTGAISGPGNFVKMTQGAPCLQAGTSPCPPPAPEPLR